MKRNKKGQANNYVIALLALVVFVLIALAFLNVTANGVSRSTKLSVTNNETTSLTSCYTTAGQVNESNPACNIIVDNWYPAGDWRIGESACALSTVSVKNDTGTALTAGTDYKIYPSSGKIQLLNTTTTANSSTTLSNNEVGLYYSTCPSGYMTSSGDRSIFSLVNLLLIILIVGVIAGTVYKFFKK